MTAFITPADVRGYMGSTSSTDNWSDANLGSNIRAASEFLQRETGRQFENQLATTKTFTTNGSSVVRIPDLRSATSVSLQGTVLTTTGDNDARTGWLIPPYPGAPVSTQLQLRTFGGSGGYRSHPQWWDRNLDNYWAGGNYSIPDDLEITGDWGWDPLPETLLHATKILAAWYAKRRDAVLVSVALTPEGGVLNYADLPPEVKDFISSWKLGVMAVVV